MRATAIACILAILVFTIVLWTLFKPERASPPREPPPSEERTPSEVTKSAPVPLPETPQKPEGRVRHGEVKRLDSGDPLEGADVFVSAYPSGFPPRRLARATTDVRGRYSFHHPLLRKGRKILVEVRAPGFVPWTVVAPSDGAEMLPPARLLSGTEVLGQVLRPDGTPATEGFVVAPTVIHRF